MKYIDSDALLERLDNYFERPNLPLSTGVVISMIIQGSPAADVAPVVHAEWRKDNDAIVCSSCGFGMFPIFTWSKRGNHKRDTFKPRFCPDCGAKMDAETP